MKSNQARWFTFGSISKCILAVLLVSAMGCSPLSTVYEKSKNLSLPFSSSDKVFKKKLGIASVKNLYNTRDSLLSQQLESLLIENLKTKCKQAVVVLPGNTGDASFLRELPKDVSGEPDIRLIAQKSRIAGLDAIVSAHIGGISREKKKEGWSWSKKSPESIRIWMKVEVYDAHTGAKVLFDHPSVEVELNKADSRWSDETELAALTPVMDEMAKAAKTMGSAICGVIKKEPWKGFVISSEKDKVFISSGSDVGIQVGDVFSVYAVLEAIDGDGGQVFRRTGERLDEVKISSVLPNQSEGLSVSGNPIPAGSVVQLN